MEHCHNGEKEQPIAIECTTAFGPQRISLASKLSDSKSSSILKDNPPQALMLHTPENKEAWRVIAAEAAQRVNGLTCFDDMPALKTHDSSDQPMIGMPIALKAPHHNAHCEDRSQFPVVSN